MKKKLLYLSRAAVAVFAGLILFSCTQSIKLTTEGERHEILTVEQMLEDYDYMWQILEDNYPFFEASQRVYGVDWKQIIYEFRPYIQILKDGDLVGFNNVINKCLSSFRSSGHLMVVDTYAFDAYADSANQGESTQANLAVFRDKRSIGAYNKLKNSSEYKPNLSPEKQGQDYIDSSVSMSYESGVPRVSLKTFLCPDEAVAEEMAKKVSEYLSKCINADNIIIDLRGNRGGASKVWEDSFIPFLGKDAAVVTSYGAYKNGEQNRKMFYFDPLKESSYAQDEYTSFDVEAWPIGELDKISDGVDISGVHHADIDKFDYLVKSIMTVRQKAMQNKEFLGKIWILIDNHVASSADLLLDFLRENANSETVGTQTRGLGGFFFTTSEAMLPLPNSGLIVRYQPFYLFNSDGSCKDFGTPPDIAIADGEDALEVCLAEIAKGK